MLSACRPVIFAECLVICAGLLISRTILVEKDSYEVLDEGADVEQHSRGVGGAETQLDHVGRVVVAQCEVVVVGVDPDGPRCLLGRGLLPDVVPQPRADFKVGSNILCGRKEERCC